MLKWIFISGCKEESDINGTSTDWGNFIDSEFSYIADNGSTSNKNRGSYKLINTGASEVTKANNIYDLAGNVQEMCWRVTGQQTGGGYYILYRGGDYIKKKDSTDEGRASRTTLRSYDQASVTNINYYMEVTGCRSFLYF